MNDKIGIGLVSLNSSEHFIKCATSIISLGIDIHAVLAQDSQYPKDLTRHFKSIKYFNSKIPSNWVKNHLLRLMINDGYKHLFLINDNVEIIDSNIFALYIITGNKTGIKYLNAIEPNNVSIIKNTIDYDQDTSVVFSSSLTSDFTYINKSVIKNIGYLDERFPADTANLELLVRAINNNYHPPLGWYADINNSNLYIKYNGYNKTNISNKDIAFFKLKHKIDIKHLPDVKEEVILKHLEEIQNLNATK